jgi:hypothetical protein
MPKEELKIEISEEEETKRGENLVRLFSLKSKKNGRYETAWGDKTALGLFRTVHAVVNGKG